MWLPLHVPASCLTGLWLQAELQEVEKRLQGSAQVGQDLRPTAKDINGNVTDLVSRGPSN